VAVRGKTRTSQGVGEDLRDKGKKKRTATYREDGGPSANWTGVRERLREKGRKNLRRLATRELGEEGQETSEYCLPAK